MANPRKPTRKKIIQGTFRTDRAPKNEPEPTPVGEPPKPPYYLPEAAKELWRKLATELVEKGLLTVVDVPALEICCMNYGLYRELWDTVHCMIEDSFTGKRRRQTLAEYMDGRNSQTMPEYTNMQKAFATFKSYLIEFGLTPAARSRVDLPEKAEEPQDPVEGMWNEM